MAFALLDGTRMKSTWLIAFTLAAIGCEDKQCHDQLAADTARCTATQKELAAAKAENATLKTKAAKMDELIAQVAALTTENEKLKAAPPPPPAKPGKK
jgi:cell division protein FtsB